MKVIEMEIILIQNIKIKSNNITKKITKQFGNNVKTSERSNVRTIEGLE